MKINVDTDESFKEELNDQINAAAALREFLTEGSNVKEFTEGNPELLEALANIVPIALPGATLEGLESAYREMSPESQAEWLLDMVRTVESFQAKLEDKLDELEEECEEGEEGEEDSFEFSLNLDDLLGMLEGFSSQIPNLLDMLPGMIEAMDLDEEQAQQIWDSLKYRPVQMIAKDIDPETIKSLFETLGLFYGPMMNDFCNVASKPAKLANDIACHPKIEKERLREIERKTKDTATAFLTYLNCGVSKRDAMKLIFAEKQASLKAKTASLEKACKRIENKTKEKIQNKMEEKD